MDTEALVGQQFGNYVVRRLLGKGGMGAVFLAENPAIKRQVAIKVLPPELSHNAQNVERFLAEARAVASIRHPNLIDVYDFGTSDNGQLYYVMEVLEGRDLGDVLSAKRKMPALEVLPYVEQICAALEAVHQSGIIHRDLKPGNIFVQGEDPVRVKLLDFGLAKLLERSGNPELTGTGVILGTPLTMAPEQAASKADLLSPQTDIYALGVIMFWMLAARPPFMSEIPALVVSHHIMQPAPLLRALEPSVPPTISDLVDRCLAKKPADRPASASAVAAEFASGVGGDGIGHGATLPPPPRQAEPAAIPTASLPFTEEELLARLPRRGPSPPSRLYLAAVGAAVVITALLVLLVT